MSALYWIAKYVDDPFRNEPRNVGVIVQVNGVLSSRFFGEKDDGTLDGRKIVSKFSYPNVYSQWHGFWRSKVRSGDIQAIINGKTVNYYVQEGGEVSDIGADTAGEVCQFLYSLLVGAGAVEAFDWTEAEENEVDLASDIAGAFAELHVLAGGAQLFARHPVVKAQNITGRHVTHTPSFSQRNGALYVFEHIDLSNRKINKTKERAGWMAYMFADIHDTHHNFGAYSIVRPERDSGAEQIQYAKAVLEGESTLVNWANDNERNRFLEERRRIAESVAP